MSESLAVAKLLAEGHKVAQPVVDDDGVDLVVDYSTLVQVKGAGQFDRSGFINVTISYNGKPYLRPHVHVLIVHARNIDQWWVLPVAAVKAKKHLRLGPQYDEYKDAWHLLNDPEAIRSRKELEEMSRVVSVRWDDELIDQIDAVRGDVPRSKWVQRAVEAALPKSKLQAHTAEVVAATQRIAADNPHLSPELKEKLIPANEVKMYKCSVSGCATRRPSENAPCPHHPGKLIPA